MAKTLIICFQGEPQSDLRTFADVLSSRIKPDNIEVPDPYVYLNNRVFTYIFNPTTTIRYNKGSVCLGVVDKFASAMLEPRSAVPDGTFALIRVDSDWVEAVSDYTATRTIWYVKTEEFFAVSTSQRMIVAFLGDFEPNDKAVRWMLSAGVIGPGQAWDKRVKPVPGNSSVLLDRKRWSLTEEGGTAFDIVSNSQPQSWYESNFKNVLRNTISGLDINYSQWTLALSGGLDSRSIFYYLKDSSELDTT